MCLGGSKEGLCLRVCMHECMSAYICVCIYSYTFTHVNKPVRGRSFLPSQMGRIMDLVFACKYEYTESCLLIHINVCL